MKKQDKDSRFQTHIAEPRWQQIASIGIVVGGLALWLGLAIWST